MKYFWLLVIILGSTNLCQAQQSFSERTLQHEQIDSIKNKTLLSALGDGYISAGFFDFDLRYLIKYNQYEGFRTGLGGVTNSKFSEKYRLEGYTVYGFLDHTFKYSAGGGIRVSEANNSWISLAYTSDLQETGSSVFLTDKRFFQLFEPRLININLFHKHITKSLSIEHQFYPKLVSELQLGVSKISPTYAYTFILPNTSFTNFDLSYATVSLQWNPFDTIEEIESGETVNTDGFPKFTFQYSQNFSDVLGGDFSFSKIDFRTFQQFIHKNEALTEVVLTTGIANGDVPLTHMYHAYPNNVNKETILQRFSVAGTNSFETMYFNEFFSDKFATLLLKHKLKPFNISPRFRPQLVLLTKFAIGNMDDPQRHESVSFETLEHGFSESGFEINKLFIGFGLSFAYRYGAYHLPEFEDNLAFKFTFNLSLDK